MVYKRWRHTSRHSFQRERRYRTTRLTLLQGQHDEKRVASFEEDNLTAIRPWRTRQDRACRSVVAWVAVFAFLMRLFRC